MAAEEQDVRIELSDMDSKVFDCPTCGTHLQFNTEIGIRKVKVAETPPVGWSKRIDPLTVPERAVVEECKESGLYAHYIAAFNASKLAGKPKDPEKFFIQFLTHATKKHTPQFAIRLCLPEDDRKGDLELWTHGIVGAVLVDGEFKHFLPTELVNGQKSSNVEYGGKGWIQGGEKIDLNSWIKTRFGYVQGRGLMFQALRQRCIGDFAK